VPGPQTTTLRALAKALRSWRASCVGNVRLQLAAARAVVYELDLAQESRLLSQGELDLRRELKANILGLASLKRTMARQRARTRNLQDGDACTKYFHLQACHRSWNISSLNVKGTKIIWNEGIAEALFANFDAILGTNFVHNGGFRHVGAAGALPHAARRMLLRAGSLECR